MTNFLFIAKERYRALVMCNDTQTSWCEIDSSGTLPAVLLREKEKDI